MPSVRNPIRRLSYALRLNKPVEQAPPDPNSQTLARFLAESKKKYLADVAEKPSKGGEWTVVMGNEAGDLDSLASSIAFSWLQSEVHKKPTIPLLQLERDDLDLRVENTHALSLAGITEPKEQLLYLTDIKDWSTFPSHNFALVDHNRLGPRFIRPESKVVAVIDHHADEGLYKDTANPRTITICGSCASHVAALCPSEIPAELATLLLSAILIDTNGLKPNGKALATDMYAAGFLASRSTISQNLPRKLVASLLDDPNSRPEALYDANAIRELTSTLRTKKSGVSHLSERDLIRRDYKEYDYVVDGKTIRAGLASVPAALKAFGKDGKLEKAAEEWMSERGIQILGILTSFRDSDKLGKSGKGKHLREQAWVVYDPAAQEAAGQNKVEELAAQLWKGLEDSSELKLKKHKKFDLEKSDRLPTSAKARGYVQGNVDATRKVTAPLLKDIVEGLKGDGAETK